MRGIVTWLFSPTLTTNLKKSYLKNLGFYSGKCLMTVTSTAYARNRHLALFTDTYHVSQKILFQKSCLKNPDCSSGKCLVTVTVLRMRGIVTWLFSPTLTTYLKNPDCRCHS